MGAEAVSQHLFFNVALYRADRATIKLSTDHQHLFINLTLVCRADGTSIPLLRQAVTLCVI